MKREIALSTQDSSINKIYFEENAFNQLALKFAAPSLTILTAVCTIAAVALGSPVMLVGICLSLPLTIGVVAMDGRSARRKVLSFAKSKGIEFTKDERKQILRNLRLWGNAETLMVGEESLSIDTSWTDDTRNVNVEILQPNRKDEFNEAFYHALTINNADLDSRFSKGRAVNSTVNTPFHKEIAGRIEKLNELVANNSSQNTIPYALGVRDNVINIGFSNRDQCNGVSLKSYFKGIENVFEKNLMEGLKAQYAEHQQEPVS